MGSERDYRTIRSVLIAGAVWSLEVLMSTLAAPPAELWPLLTLTSTVIRIISSRAEVHCSEMHLMLV